VRLFGPLHLALLATIAVLCFVAARLCVSGHVRVRPLRLGLGTFLAVDEFVWWIFRYSHEGIHAANLPLQLCDLTVWLSVLACLTLQPAIVEFAYFAGLAGAGMALLTPDLWSPWPTYPAIYFFVAHGGIVIAVSMLVFGRVVTLRGGAVWRAYAYLLTYACTLALINQLTGSNYMYLCRKPRGSSALDAFGPWPFYLLAAAALALAFFWVLWLAAPKETPKKL
jgi:hypothetical integral membrane protein (TIGR02206 family)